MVRPYICTSVIYTTIYLYGTTNHIYVVNTTHVVYRKSWVAERDDEDDLNSIYIALFICYMHNHISIWHNQPYMCHVKPYICDIQPYICYKQPYISYTGSRGWRSATTRTTSAPPPLRCEPHYQVDTILIIKLKFPSLSLS